jgi:hypothetical protein
MASLEKMDVVRRDQPEPEFLRKQGQRLVALLLDLDAVVVHLEEKILRPKNVAKVSRTLPRLGEIVRLDRHVDLALETPAQADQPGGMFREQLLVNPRFVMKSIEVRGGNQFHQVAITRVVPGQEREVIGRVALVCGPVFYRPRRHVRFAADDGLDPALVAAW